MSRESSKSSNRRTKTASQALDRAFDPAILKRARTIVEGYHLVLEPDSDLGFVGRALELPTGFADGATPDECVKATREGLTAAVATMLEAGQRPPAPASAARRQKQINIRVSAEEKLVMEEAARQNGFRGVSDFVRFAALDRAVAPAPRKRRK